MPVDLVTLRSSRTLIILNNTKCVPCQFALFNQCKVVKNKGCHTSKPFFPAGAFLPLSSSSHNEFIISILVMMGWLLPVLMPKVLLPP